MAELAPKSDPDLLLEASRVFNAAGDSYKTLAEVVSDMAVANTETASDELKAAIYCDAAALRLSKRLPGGYKKAIELLDKVLPAKAEDKGGRLYALQALAKGQMYDDLRPTGDEATKLAQSIASDMREAIKRDPKLYERLSHHWVAPKDKEAKENDLQIAFEQSEAVQKVVAEFDPNPKARRDTTDPGASPLRTDQANTPIAPTDR